MKKLQGTRFGDFTVTKQTDERQYGYVVWMLICDECGATKKRTTQEISMNRGMQCDCSRKVRRFSIKPGDTCGRLKVGQLIEGAYECTCSCGDIIRATAHDLLYGKKSCGCAINKDGTYKLVSGYIMERCVGHPRANRGGYVLQHILVMEEKLGRSVERGETIHHINGIRWDNRPENLYLFNSNGDHVRFHFMFKKGTHEVLTVFGDIMREHYSAFIPRLSY